MTATQGKWDNGREPRAPSCLYCRGEVFNTLGKKRQFFDERKLCYSCGREGHGTNYCRSRLCFKCKLKHHSSLCDRPSLNGPIGSTVFSACNPGSEDRSLPAIIPLKIHVGDPSTKASWQPAVNQERDTELPCKYLRPARHDFAHNCER